MNILGNRIKYIRDKRNLSQKRLAESLGISNVQLSRYESGDRKPDPEVIAQIAELLEVTTDYLLGRSDNPSPTLVRKSEDENLFFFDEDNITPEEMEKLKEHLEFLRYQAAKENKKQE